MVGVGVGISRSGSKWEDSRESVDILSFLPNL